MTGRSVGEWLAVLDEWYPPAWAEPWDSVGLQVGERSWAAERALVALDPTEEVIAEAAERACGVLVTHHPLIFRPLPRMDLADPVARRAAAALGSEIAVVACHTNADVADPGVSDALAEALGIEVDGILHRTEAGARVKLVSFVPPEATGKVLDAAAAAGAGGIGEYTHCSFRVRGTGTFIPSDRARPTIGERGSLNEVEEDRLEVVVPAERVTAVVEALLDAHPYEEVAYDLVPLVGGDGLGLGRIGALAAPTTAGELSARCEEILRTRVRLAGDPGRAVRRVAVCGGSGASMLPDALAAGVDAFVTGDLKHHEALDAAASGLAVIDAGHHGTEWPFVPALAGRLSAADLGEILVSEIRTDPFGGP